MADPDDVEPIRQVLRNTRPTLPREVPPPPVNEYAPAPYRDSVARALEKSPLRIIADAIVDLRYGPIKEMAEGLAQIDADNDQKPKDYAELLHNWALMIRKEKKQEPFT